MKVIMHNSVTLDMSMKGFSFNLGVHYNLVEKFNPDVYMFGSTSGVVALESGLAEDVPEGEFKKREKPYWVIIDSKGQLEKKLHFYRNSPYAGKLIILVSKKTPQSYFKYLKKDEYSFIETGIEYVDYTKALQILEKEYSVKTIVLDSGGLLNRFFFEQNLIDEISLVVHPFVKGKDCLNMFRHLSDAIKLTLEKVEKINDLVWVHYKVQK
jgi:riboflavin biosynthesis pyrimidine reductase